MASSSSSSSSSDSSSSSSSEEEKKVVDTPKIAHKKGSSSSSSSSSDSSDSEAQKKVVAKKKKESKKEAKKKAEAEAKKKAEAEAKKKAEESSSSSSSSSSEDEAPAKKVAETKKKDSSSSSSDSSDSDSDDEKPKEKKTVDVTPKETKTASKSVSSGSSSSSSSSDSDSDDEDTKESEVPAADEGVPSKKRKAETVLSNDNGDKKQHTGEEGGENTKIYIRGLPWRATEEEVRDFFTSCGEMTSVELPLQDDGRSSGTAIIAFSNAASAAAAMEHNGADFNGRWLNIKYSTSKPVTAAREPSQKEEGCMTVFVGNLSFHIDEETVRDTFKDCGEITAVRFAEDKETGQFKGFGHVEFAETESTDAAVALAGTYVMDRPLRVDFANERRDRGFGGGGGNSFGAKKTGAIAAFSGNKITFD